MMIAMTDEFAIRVDFVDVAIAVINTIMTNVLLFVLLQGLVSSLVREVAANVSSHRRVS